MQFTMEFKSSLGNFRFITVTTLFLVVLLVTACGEATKDSHPNQVLTKRQALFKQFTKTLEPMVSVSNDRTEYKKDEFLTSARDLEKISTKPWAYFTQDGNYPPTKARSEVWTDAAQFKIAQDNYLAAVKRLVEVSEKGDVAVIKTALSDVSGNCKSCHKKFRTD